MIEEQTMGRVRSYCGWKSLAAGIGVGGLVCCLVALGTSAAQAQSLNPPIVVTVQAAVTTPPTVPVTTPPTVAVAGSLNPSSPAGTGTVPAITRYSDPLSDMSTAALDALRTGSSTRGTQAFAATQATTPNTSARAASVQGPAASQSGQGSWSSVVIDTAQLGDYLFGTAISAPISPTISVALAALPVEPSARYAATLHALAGLVGARAKVDAAALETVWLRTDERRMRTVLTAMAQVGTMYRAAGNQPGGFDCSGLTSYAWAQAGVKIPRTSTDQIAAAAVRSPDQLLPGDIIWHPGHIGLYLGVGDAMVHSSQTGKPVEVKGWGRAQRWGSPI